MKSRATGPLQLGPVQRLLRSESFRQSRDEAVRIFDDADALRRLGVALRARDHRQGSLEPIADHIDAALCLLDDRADQLERHGPDGAPARITRHRLVIAGLLYLDRADDVIPDDAPGGDLDDMVVLREVLGTAKDDLLPYLNEPATDDRRADG